MWRSCPLLLVLAGCVATQDELAREAARQAVAQAVSARFPGVPVTPLTDCIIDNATGAEIIRVATGSRDGRPSAETVRAVADVIGRPDTIACLGYEALPLLVS